GKEMKHLKIWDDRGYEILDILLPLEGEDCEFELHYPLVIYLRRIVIEEHKKEPKEDD
ncbi:unnamed protein product, partial [marine sediment metagenome]